MARTHALTVSVLTSSIPTDVSAMLGSVGSTVTLIWMIVCQDHVVAISALMVSTRTLVFAMMASPVSTVALILTNVRRIRACMVSTAKTRLTRSNVYAWPATRTHCVPRSWMNAAQTRVSVASAQTV